MVLLEFFDHSPVGGVLFPTIRTPTTLLSHAPPRRTYGLPGVSPGVPTSLRFV